MCFFFRRVCSLLFTLAGSATSHQALFCPLWPQASKVWQFPISVLRQTRQKLVLWAVSPKVRMLGVCSTLLFPFQWRSHELSFFYHKQCWLMGGADAAETKWLFLPITMWLFLALSLPRHCGFLTGFWSSQKGFLNNILVKLVSVWRKGLGFVFWHLAVITPKILFLKIKGYLTMQINAYKNIK